jgi:hypothetical protein
MRCLKISPTGYRLKPRKNRKKRSQRDHNYPVDISANMISCIREAADMGDVTKIISVAEEIKSDSETMAPFCNSVIQLADNFDFDGIHKLMVAVSC